jgi:hypothetical protein
MDGLMSLTLKISACQSPVRKWIRRVAELQRDATGGALNFWYLKPLNEQSVHSQLRTRYEAHVWTLLKSSCESKDRNKKKGQSFKEVKFLFVVEAYCDERNILKPSDGRSQGKTAVSSKVKSKGRNLVQSPKNSVGRASREYCLSHNARYFARALETSYIANPACDEL